MDLNNWNLWFENWSATFAGFSAIGLLALKSVLDAIGNRKIRFDYTSFRTLQTSVRDEVKAVLKITVDSFEEIKRDVIQPLVDELKQKDYQTAILVDVVVTLMANVQVPLDQKQDAFKRLSTLDIMNKEIISKITANLQKESQQVVVEQNAVNQVYEQLNKGV